MKLRILALSCICVLILASCDNQIGKKTAPKPAPKPQTTAQKPAPQKPAPQKPAPQKPAPQKPAPQQKSSIADDVNSVINYGTGATAIQAKKKMMGKLQNAQGQHDKQMQDAMK